MSKQDIQVVSGQIAIIYEVIREKSNPDAFDWEMYDKLVRKYDAISVKLDKTVYPFDPDRDDLDVETVNSYIFHEDSLTNMKHWIIDCKIREGQISVLKKLIEKKRNRNWKDSELTVELNKLKKLGVHFNQN